MTESLHELGLRFGTDKAGHRYLPRYERHLSYMHYTPMRLLEVGVLGGASLRMWEAYFERGTITGLDIAPETIWTSERIQTIVIDVKVFTPPDLLGYDVIVDDGSHAWRDIIEAHHRLWPHVRPGGWYCIEDLDAQEFSSSKVFDLLFHIIGDLAHEQGDVGELHIYDQIALIRKR